MTTPNWREKLEGMRKPLKDEPGGTEANIRIAQYNHALTDIIPVIEQAVAEKEAQVRDEIGIVARRRWVTTGELSQIVKDIQALTHHHDTQD